MRILVAGSHEIARAGLCLILERGWNVVAEPTEAAIGKVIELQPE